MTVRAIAIYVLLWIPAILVSGIITLAGVMTFHSAPVWSALSFLLALPAVLAGLKSFRWSAFVLAALFVWDVVTTTWPHVTLSGIWNSPVDSLLLIASGLACLVAFLSPFTSIGDFVDYVRFG